MARTPEEAINSYITDMLALEEHILTAVQGQQDSLKDEHPQFAGVLRTVESMATAHVNALKELAERREGGAGRSLAEAVKKAGSVVLGFGAAAVDLVRTERVPKNIRDDFTALSLAHIGYAMLFTTATALGDSQVAALASAQHRDYIKVTMDLHEAAPASVLALLREEGLIQDESSLQEINRELESHFRELEPHWQT